MTQVGEHTNIKGDKMCLQPNLVKDDMSQLFVSSPQSWFDIERKWKYKSLNIKQTKCPKVHSFPTATRSGLRMVTPFKRIKSHRVSKKAIPWSLWTIDARNSEWVRRTSHIQNLLAIGAHQPSPERIQAGRPKSNTVKSQSRSKSIREVWPAGLIISSLKIA